MDGADSRQAMKRSCLWSGLVSLSPRKRAGGLGCSTAHCTTLAGQGRAGFRFLAVLLGWAR